MIRRPWSIFMLAFFHWVTPVVSILLNSWLTHSSPIEIIRQVNTLPARDIFEFWCLMPLAGIGIYAVRWWSYPVVLIATFWITTSNVFTWQDQPQTIPFWVLGVMFALDLALIFYLLIPQVRLTYFNPRVRWWETQPRYAIGSTATVKRASQQLSCKLANLSVGGCYIDMTEAKLKTNETVGLIFPLYSAEFSLAAEVVRESKTGYGLRFVHTPETLNQMKRLVRALEMVKIERNPPYVDGIKSYVEWAKMAVTRGKGLVPEIPDSYLKK